MLRMFTPLSPQVSEAEQDFFNAHDDSGGSLAPTEVDSYEALSDEAPLAMLTPAQLARRARLRRIVSGVVGVAGIVSVFTAARLVRARPHDAAASGGVLSAQASLASIDMEREAFAAAAPEAAASDQADALSPERTRAVEPAKTKKMILSAISHGQYGEAVSLARAALALDPGDAQIYLLLGSALQELGQWDRAAGVFADCARRARRGPKSECRALAGQ
jgi:tetratricopeptide (TPR) repeat protein